MIAELASDQWGLFTTAQATDAGVTRMMLSRMEARGELERVVHGVYATPAAAGGELSERRALWLSLEPARLAYQRLAESPPAGVLSRASAAAMHGIGDILESQMEVTLPARYRARRAGLRTRRGVLRSDEVTIVDGLPVTTPARTVADLLSDGHDRDHVAAVMADALKQGLVKTQTLQTALEHVERNKSGYQLLTELLAIAGIDPESLMQEIVSSQLGKSATEAAARRLMTQAMPFSKPHRALAEQMKRQQQQAGAAMISQALNNPSLETLKSTREAIKAAAEVTPSMPELSFPGKYLKTAAGLGEMTEMWRRLALVQRTAIDLPPHEKEEDDTT